MSDSEKLSVAGLLYVTLRRKLNRGIDVEWLLRNETYAQEVMQLARRQGDEELARYADRLDGLFSGRATAPVAPVAAPVVAAERVPADATDDVTGQYIGALR